LGFATSAGFKVATSFGAGATLVALTAAAFFVTAAGFKTLRAAGFAATGFATAFRAGAFAVFVFTADLVFALAKFAFSFAHVPENKHRFSENDMRQANERAFYHA
jgi:hypothetical protein